MNLQQTYFLQDRRVDALRAAEQLLEIRPNSHTFLWRAAEAALGVGDRAKARRFADRARALDMPLGERTAWQTAWLRVFVAHEAWLADDPRRALRIADQMAVELSGLPSAARPP